MGMATPTDNSESVLPLRSDEDARMSAPSCVGECAAQDDAVGLTITDDMTADLPISMAELEAIETYLADVLDRVLSGDKDAAQALRCHKRMR